jgi:hypothetical protein
MFDETQVTKVDKLQGDVRDVRAKVEEFRAHDGAAAPELSAALERAKADSADLAAYLTTKAAVANKNSQHYRSLARTTGAVRSQLTSMNAAAPDPLPETLTNVEATLVQLTRQPPYTLLLMRAVEIGLPLLACLFALLFVRRYGLTETRSREIKEELARRHPERDAAAKPAVV